MVNSCQSSTAISCRLSAVSLFKCKIEGYEATGSITVQSVKCPLMGFLDVLMRRGERFNPCRIFYIKAAEERAAACHITPWSAWVKSDGGEVLHHPLLSITHYEIHCYIQIMYITPSCLYPEGSKCSFYVFYISFCSAASNIQGNVDHVRFLQSTW